MNADERCCLEVERLAARCKNLSPVENIRHAHPVGLGRATQPLMFGDGRAIAGAARKELRFANDGSFHRKSFW
jgi:hypothetical protein